MSNIIKIGKFDIANGEGIRTSIFFSGCEFRCKDCFNAETWDFNKGTEFNRDFYENHIKPTINEHIAGISILGGEPLHRKNISAVFDLISWFKKDFPEKTVWLWTGYTLEEIEEEAHIDSSYVFLIIAALKNIDVLVDGRFIAEEKDLILKWRGSRNQRVIDMQKTFEEGKCILYCD